MAKTYYDILGVSETASPDEIKKQFRKLAKKYHPDRNKGDKTAEATFKELSEAYDTLSDPKKKTEYDQMLKYGAFANAGPYASADHGFDWSQFGGNGSTRVHVEGFDNIDDLGELLDSLFGGRAGGPTGSRFDFNMGRSQENQPRKGRDVETELSVSFWEAISGAERLLSRGRGRERLKVRIPAGIEDGGRIRLTGQGEPGLYGGPNGDILITVRVMADPVFSRKGNDIYTLVEIPFTEAILGCKKTISTLTKSVSLTIPPGTQPGTLMRLKGQGLAVGGDQGDLYVEVKVTIPKRLSEKQRKMMEEWEK
ncbi:MAG: J domain-containing protein [Candidatus Zixiibacteriota bacterium]